MTPPQQQNPNELLSITREELERCCSQMSAAGYKVSANYVEASVLSRSRPATPPDEHYNGRCAMQDKCNDYSDFIESIGDELDPDDEDPVCPIKCELRKNPQEQHDAAIASKAREECMEKAEHLAQTIPVFNRMDYIHLLKESLRSSTKEQPK